MSETEHVEFCRKNILEKVSGVSLLASSEEPGYTAGNIFTQKRTEVWKPTTPGRFYVNSTYPNKTTVVFSEGGPNLNATVPNGDYSVTGFAAAVQAAMNAVGANTYTVLYYTNWKFRVKNSICNAKHFKSVGDRQKVVYHIYQAELYLRGMEDMAKRIESGA